MEPTEYLDSLRADLDAIAATPPEVLGESVPACPEWTVQGLLGHHEGVLRFATAQLQAAPGSEIVKFDPPDEDVDRIAAFTAAARPAWPRSGSTGNRAKHSVIARQSASHCARVSEAVKRFDAST